MMVEYSLEEYSISIRIPLEDRFSDATIRCLDVKQCAYGRGDVGHVARLGAGSVLDAPSHENQRDMGVVAIPCSVGGTLHAIAVVGWLQDNLHATAALTVVTVDDAIFHFLRYAFDGGFFHVASILYHLVFLQAVDYLLLDGCIVET